jgi:hypothetical protein
MLEQELVHVLADLNPWWDSGKVVLRAELLPNLTG